MYTIYRYTGSIEVWPDTQEVRNFLTLLWREMVHTGRDAKYVPRRSKMFKVSSDSGQARLHSFRGFWKSLEEFLKKRKRIVVMVDRRAPFPKPDIAAAMRPLRDYQRAPFLKFLLADDSGMAGLPTRFGKTFGMISAILAYWKHPGMKIVVTAPGIDLCMQLQEDLRNNLPKEIDVRGIYTGSKNRTQSDNVTVVCSKSLSKCDTDGTMLLIVDETHAWASDDCVTALASFQNARVLAFGATLDGRSDRRDRILVGLAGPVWSSVSYLDAVKVGAISPCHIVMVRVPICYDDVENCYDRASAYKKLLTMSERMAALTKRILVEAIPDGWQTMVFINDEKQADFYMENALSKVGVVAMAKKMVAAVRKKMTREIAAALHKWVIASKIYIQGVTFPDLRVLINAAGGGRNTGTIQRPGRLLQRRPGKLYGVQIDFMFANDGSCPEHGAWQCVVREASARLAVYNEIGYDVTHVDTIEEIAQIIKSSYGSVETENTSGVAVPERPRQASRAPRVITPAE